MKQMLLALAAVLVTVPAMAQSVATPQYKTDHSLITELARDLYDMLPSQHRVSLKSPPVYFTSETIPLVQPCTRNEGDSTFTGVMISAGFVDLMNYLCHAKAIDQWDRGFLKKYVSVLSQSTGVTPLQEQRKANLQRVWAHQTMNCQISHFNQMVGTIIAIDLAHHYLGHYRKYEQQLTDTQGRPVPINLMLTEEEWRAALRAGVSNSLECGLCAEGLKLMYDSIARMETRPAWTLYFLPAKVKLSKVKRDVEKIEKEFFDVSNGRTQMLGG